MVMRKRKTPPFAGRAAVEGAKSQSDASRDDTLAKGHAAPEKPAAPAQPLPRRRKKPFVL